MHLENKLILITGAGSGIGRALAVEASRRGMTVALCGRRMSALTETLELLDRAKANLVLPADITRKEDRHALRDQIGQTWGRLDVLINNAGILEVGPLESLLDPTLEQTVATNITAPIALTRDMLPLLAVARPSRIVNIGSVLGDIPYPFMSAYSATKFALRGFSIALRREIRGRGIGVTYAAPRTTKTASADKVESLLKMKQAQIDQPERVATQIWNAIERDADSVYAAGPERIFILVQRLFPQLVDRAISKQISNISSD